MILAFVLLLQLKVPDAAQFVGPPKGTPIAGEQLFERTNEVSKLLRCPVCQGMAVADSPAEMAVNMKSQVRELLARGYTEEQILQYFELSYGQFVLLKPKQPMVWLLPILAALIGAAIVFLKLRKLSSAPPPPSAIGHPPSAINDEYVNRVRDLVKGKS